jgi:DNA-binding transcriptional LysR family regulator
MQLKQLEENIGLPLFERIGREVRLTAVGTLFVHHAARILGEIKDTEFSLKGLQDAETGQITVGMVSTAKYFMPRLLAGYSRENQGVDVQFMVGNRELILQKLVDNELDLAIMGRIPSEIDATSLPMASHPYVIVAPSDHPLVNQKTFDLQELRQDTFLLREEGSGSRRVAEEMFKNHLFTPAKTLSLGSNETIKQAVMAGMGISLISLHTIMLELKTGDLKVLNVLGTPIERKWHLVHMNSKKLLPSGQRFKSYLLEHAQLMLNP